MKRFDEHIKNSLRDYGEEPDDIVWATLKGDLLAEKKQKRRKVFFVVLLFTTMAGAFTLGIQRFYSNSAAEIAETNTVRIEKNRQKTTAIQRPFTSQHQAVQPSEHINITKGHKHDGLSITGFEPHNALSEISNPNIEIITPAMQTSGQTMATDNSMPEGLESSLSKLPFRKQGFPFKDPEILQELKSPLILKKAFQPFPYFVSFMLMPTLTDRIVTGDPTILSERNKHETDRKGLSIGLSAGKHIDPHLDISAGLNITLYEQKIQHAWEETTYFMDSMKVQKRRNREVFYYRYQDTAIAGRTASFTNRFAIIQLPVNMQFNMPLSARTSFYASTGLNITYILQSQMNVNYEANNGLQIEKTPYQRSYRRLGAAAELGCGISVKLNSRYEVSGGLHSTISSNYFIKGKIKEYPYMAGLRICIRRNF